MSSGIDYDYLIVHWNAIKWRVQKDTYNYTNNRTTYLILLLYIYIEMCIFYTDYVCYYCIYTRRDTHMSITYASLTINEHTIT